jgi:hypothetical protein
MYLKFPARFPFKALSPLKSTISTGIRVWEMSNYFYTLRKDAATNV